MVAWCRGLLPSSIISLALFISYFNGHCHFSCHAWLLLSLLPLLAMPLETGGGMVGEGRKEMGAEVPVLLGLMSTALNGTAVGISPTSQK